MFVDDVTPSRCALPPQHEGGARRRLPEPDPTDRLDLTGHRIVVVDDNDDDLALLAEMIRWFGATVTAARDARSALLTLATGPRPDLILCDLRMPGMDGYELLATIRNDPRLARVPVIAVSALGSPADFMKTWEAGFAGHLVKPVDSETMTAQLERVFWAHGRPN